MAAIIRARIVPVELERKNGLDQQENANHHSPLLLEFRRPEKYGPSCIATASRLMLLDPAAPGENAGFRARPLYSYTVKKRKAKGWRQGSVLSLRTGVFRSHRSPVHPYDELVTRIFPGSRGQRE